MKLLGISLWLAWLKFSLQHWSMVTRQYKVVHGPRVAVRATPATDGKIVGAYGKGTVVTGTARVGDWIKLERSPQQGCDAWMLTDGTTLGLGQLLCELPGAVDPPELMRAYSLAVAVRLPTCQGVLHLRLEVVGGATDHLDATNHVASRLEGPFDESQRKRVLVGRLQPSQRVRIRVEASDGEQSEWLEVTTVPLLKSSRCDSYDVMGIQRGPCMQCACPHFQWAAPGDGKSVLNLSPHEWCCDVCGCDPAAHAEARAEAMAASAPEEHSLSSSLSQVALAPDAERDAIVRRMEEWQSSRLWQRLPGVACVWAVSDLHVEHRENLAWLQEWPPRPEDALIVAGDLCTSLELLGTTLRALSRKFRHVFYCPGNHELWCPRSTASSPEDSVAKLFAVLEAAEGAGAVVCPALVGDELAVCPLHSWYHAGFLEGASPDELGFAQRHATPNEMAKGMDVGCRWPACLEPRLDLASLFAQMNEVTLATLATLATSGGSNGGGPLAGRQVVTFSHFLPDPKLHRGSHWLGDCEGSALLGQQVRAVGPVAHVFGHTHWEVDARHGGTRFVQRPMGYPRERKNESYRVSPKPSGPVVDLASACALVWERSGGGLQ